MQMHESQLEITVPMVQRLVAAQFPQWAGLPITPVLSHGTVNALFRLGETMTLRFPIQDGDRAAKRAWLMREFEATRTLFGGTPFATPEPLALGEPGEDFPLPWIVQTWLPGTIAEQADVADSADFARDLAQFVLAVRQIDTGGRTFSGTSRGGVLTSHDRYVRATMERARGMIDVDAVLALWHQLKRTARHEPDAMTHGDLMPNNLLAEAGRLVGVIDVGTTGPADPALDLQPAWNLFGADARAAFRAELGDGQDVWDRGRGWALAQAAGCLHYYRDTNPVMSQIAHRTLTALLNDAS